MSCSPTYNVICGYAVTDNCGCSTTGTTTTKYSSNNIAYEGPNLPCSSIDNNDTLTVAIQKLEEKICDILSSISTSTSTSTSTTSSSTTSSSTSTSTSTTTSTTTIPVAPECVLEGEITCEQ